MTAHVAQALLALAVVAADGSPAEPDGPQLPFEDFARNFLVAHGLDPEEDVEVDLEGLIDGPPYVRVVAGAFDLRFPGNHLAEKQRVQDFKEAVTAVLEMQEAWTEWSTSRYLDTDEALEDFKTLKKWVGSWPSRSLAGVGEEGERDLLTALKAKDKVVQASERLREFMSSGRGIGLEREPDEQAVVLFAPDRETFLLLAGFAGWIDAYNRGSHWNDVLMEWTRFWSGSVQIVALEYPAWPPNHEEPFAGASMNEFESTGLKQQVIEQVVQALFYSYFGTSDALFFESAAATNLTIEVCGENNVRTGGLTYKNEGNTTRPYERFVPGGNPGGGTLPARSALAGAVVDIPLWRTTVGRDNYVKPLSKAQAAGGKQAAREGKQDREEIAYFQISSAKGPEEFAVGAPFLGEPAKSKQLPPDEFLDDYEEFFRSYRACFYHWLRTEGAGRARQSGDTFADLIWRLATREPGTPFDELVEEVYGAPLSAAAGGEDSLEWRFLAWLDRQ